ETEAEEWRRLPLGRAVRAVGERGALRIADRERGGEGGAGRLLGLTDRSRAVRRGDLTAERGRFDAVREDRRAALRLRPEAQDVVAGEDVQRTPGRVVPDAHLVDEAARPAECWLEVARAAGAAVEDGTEHRQGLDARARPSARPARPPRLPPARPQAAPPWRAVRPGPDAGQL